MVSVCGCEYEESDTIAVPRREALRSESAVTSEALRSESAVTSEALRSKESGNAQ